MLSLQGLGILFSFARLGRSPFRYYNAATFSENPIVRWYIINNACCACSASASPRVSGCFPLRLPACATAHGHACCPASVNLRPNCSPLAAHASGSHLRLSDGKIASTRAYARLAHTAFVHTCADAKVFSTMSTFEKKKTRRGRRLQPLHIQSQLGSFAMQALAT